MSTVKINGLAIDAAALGEGFYRMICETGGEALVAFGMLPAPFMELIEKQIRAKVISEAAKQVCCTPEEIAPVLDEKRVKETTREIMREVCSAIYTAASNAGRMVV
jgi:hypothetical protein